MQFDTNSDLPTLEPAQAPLSFPPVDPSPCARITVRVWHRNSMMTVQNVLVKTPPAVTTANNTTTNNTTTGMNHPTTTNDSSASTGRNANHIIMGNTAIHPHHMSHHIQEDANMSSSSSSFSSDDDEDMLEDVADATNNNKPTTTGGAVVSSSSGDMDMTTSNNPSTSTTAAAPECAYWMQRTIRDAIYGRVVLAVVLTRVPPKSSNSAAHPATSSSTTTSTAAPAVAEWQVTDQQCAIKEMSWQHIRRERHRLAEDPIQEVAALFYLKQWQQQQQQVQQQQECQSGQVPPQQQTYQLNQMWENPFASIANATPPSTPTRFSSHIAPSTPNPSSSASTSSTLTSSLTTNILLPLDLLSDDRYLYSILPFCNGGELFDRLDRREKFPEPEARFWMHQIVNVRQNYIEYSGIYIEREWRWRLARALVTHSDASLYFFLLFFIL